MIYRAGRDETHIRSEHNMLCSFAAIYALYCVEAAFSRVGPDNIQ